MQLNFAKTSLRQQSQRCSPQNLFSIEFNNYARYKNCKKTAREYSNLRELRSSKFSSTTIEYDELENKGLRELQRLGRMKGTYLIGSLRTVLNDGSVLVGDIASCRRGKR